MNLDGSYECSCPSQLLGDPKVQCQRECEDSCVTTKRFIAGKVINMSLLDRCL